MNYSKSKLLILITQMERAGAQKVAITQAHYFHERGYNVTLCFFYDKYNLVAELVKQHEFSIINLNAKRINGSRVGNLVRAIRAFWRLFIHLKRQKIDIVETMTHYSNVIGIPLAWLARVPVRVSSQRNALDDFPRWFLRLDAAIVNSSMTDCMIAVSEQTRRYCIDIEGMKPEKVITIRNGIAPERFRTFSSDYQERERARAELAIPVTSPVIITIARLHPQKGHEYLIEASKQILQNYPNTIFVLVGDGDKRAQIEQLIQASGISTNFRVLGSRADVPRLLHMADIFVLPSLYEGMPNVVLEAMASQLPVVATAVDGTPEVVVDGETGMLVPPADPTALACAIEQLIANPVLRNTFGQSGLQRILAYFSEEAMCQQYEHLLLNIWAAKQRKRT
jgi:glycosyltransferase involved in cell wall biosynthesis